jgi:Na+-transporting methylmalonyl-CoA/oxaloacetate decarboxylase gamma subunit
MNTPFSIEAMQTVTQSLILMFEGMAGIFVFMAVFYGLIEFLNRIFKAKTGEEK